MTTSGLPSPVKSAITIPAGRPPWHYTRIMDRKCFELGGIKMLYSSTFLSKNEFDRLLPDVSAL